jgi:hypothetical protein
MIQIKSFSDCITTLINLNLRGPQEKNVYIYAGTQKKERRGPGYRHYSSRTPSGGLWVADRRTHDNSDPESFYLIARHVGVVTGPQQVQFYLQLREV